jgi:cell division protein FtsW
VSIDWSAPAPATPAWSPGATREGAGAAVPPRAAAAGVRQRWRMGVEARALVLVTAVLTAFGLAVLFSASAPLAVASGRPGYVFALRQATGVLAGLVAFAVAAKVDADRWRRLAWPIMGVSLFLMLLTVLPFTTQIAPRLGGSRRFLFNGSFQPSEIAKFAVLVWVPMLLVKKGEAVRRLGKGLMPFVTVIGALTVMAILEPDWSVAMMFCLLMAVLLFAGGARVAHFVFLAALAVPLAAKELAERDYVRERFRSFVAGEQVAAATPGQGSGVADQQRQSLIAVGSGRLAGVGFSNGNQARGWLPLAYNDFIGSIVGEEFGFLGIAGLTLAFTLYGWLGFRIARRARSPFCALLAIGLTFTTVLTAYIHVGVVIGLLPNTGLTLPFVSYGRSNLVLTLGMTGILANIGSVRERVVTGDATDPLVAHPA